MSHFKYIATAILLLAACSAQSNGPFSLVGSPSRRVTVSLNQEVRITLQTVGGGQYDTIPGMTGNSLTFLDAKVVQPYVPAGPTQQFRFKAVAVGQTIVAFHHSYTGQTIADTVIVR